MSEQRKVREDCQDQSPEMFRNYMFLRWEEELRVEYKPASGS